MEAQLIALTDNFHEPRSFDLQQPVNKKNLALEDAFLNNFEQLLTQKNHTAAQRQSDERETK